MFTLFRDAMMQDLFTSAPMLHNVDSQAYRATVVFLNGEYWGIHNLRETVDNYTLSSHYDLSPDDISIVEFNAGMHTTTSDVGNPDAAQDYNQLMAYIVDNQLINQEHYDYVSKRIDLDNYMIYMTAQTYLGNTDWPGNNIRYWRKESASTEMADNDNVNQDTTIAYGHDGRWRYMLYDTDFGFHIYEGMANNVHFDSLSFAAEANGPDWPNPPASTILFRHLIKNKDFLNGFVTTYANYLNTTLVKGAIHETITDYSSQIESEIKTHNQRYNVLDGWYDEVGRLHSFANERTDYMWSLLEDKYDIGSPVKLTIDVNEIEKGDVALKNFHPLLWAKPYQGQYFDQVPITLTAIPRKGSNFIGWYDEQASTGHELISEDIEMTFLPKEGQNIVAVFK